MPVVDESLRSDAWPGKGAWRVVSAALAAVLLSGCVVVIPPTSAPDFEPATSLSDLVGTYVNEGESASSPPRRYLSQYIWADDDELYHETVDRVQVRAPGGSVLVIRAMADTILIREASFVQGEDFEFERGRVVFSPGPGIVGSRPDEPVFGVETRRVEIGVDESGDGMLRSTHRLMGFAYLVVPVFASVTADVRFARID